jgi:hypothetical protein
MKVVLLNLLATGAPAPGSGPLLPVTHYEVPVKAPQEALLAVIRALYSGEIQLSPANVEHVLMVASWMEVTVVAHACAKYILETYLALPPAAALPLAPGATVPAADYSSCEQRLFFVVKLAYKHAHSLLPLLQQLLAKALHWSSPLLHRLLDTLLPSVGYAEQLLLLKKDDPELGYACPSQVLDCIKAVPSRRELLLRYVDFSAMTPEELRAVQQYAAAMCAAARAGTASAASSRRQSRISGSGADVPSGPADQFWPAVLVECGMYLAQAQPLEPAAGLLTHTVQLPAQGAGEWRWHSSTHLSCYQCMPALLLPSCLNQLSQFPAGIIRMYQGLPAYTQISDVGGDFTQ